MWVEYTSLMSNISSYRVGDDYIDIKFNGTFKIYRYSYYKTGKFHVEQMKLLAEATRLG